MLNTEYAKQCPECKNHFEARRLNQKFCSAECKIRYNNRTLRTHYHARKKEDSICRDVNNILFKNRKILKQFEGKTVKIEELTQRGFVLRFITQFERKDDKKNIFYCYDIGYEFFDTQTLTVFKN